MQRKASVAPRRKPGRPLSFDRDAALEQAMRLFWRHGYEGTSLQDLTAAMGVTPPSIYAAFLNKQGLFLEAVRRYVGNRAPSDTPTFATAREAAEDLLRRASRRFTGADTPPGCLVASAAITGSGDSADVQHALAAIRQDTEAWLRERIEHDIAQGVLPNGTDADALAGHVLAVLQGLSTLARDGAGREKLLRVAAVAMRVWPGSN